jgi:hypothetical protein
LGEPNPCKLETEICAFDPPNQCFVDAQRPSLIVKKQGKTEHHTDLHRYQRRRLTTVRRKIKNRRLAFEILLSKKEETATQAETAAPTFHRRGLVV